MEETSSQQHQLEVSSEKIGDRLERLGFKSASSRIKVLAEKKKKLAVAYEHYRYVRAEKMNDFKQKLIKGSMRSLNYGSSPREWKELSFTPLEHYQEAPPVHVLDSLEKAKEKKCFDYFSIAHVVRVKDPILFGYIEGCTDHFFIDQWDDDIRISDILKDNEG